MSSKSWIGFILIIFGFGFFLHQADVWDFPEVLSIFWPLILIIIGVVQLSNRSISSFSGILFIAIGGLFLLNQWVDMNLAAYIWPLLLIIIGLTFIFSKIGRDKSLDSERSMRVFTLFSGTEVRSQSKQFEGGNVTSIFGGAEIDLRDAIFSEKGASLEITALFGGVSIYLPENVRVEVTGIPIFGGWEDKTRRRMNNDEGIPVLYVHYLTAFGGAEIYN